jgi:hypothetical protein
VFSVFFQTCDNWVTDAVWLSGRAADVACPGNCFQLTDGLLIGFLAPQRHGVSLARKVKGEAPAASCGPALTKPSPGSFEKRRGCCHGHDFV